MVTNHVGCGVTEVKFSLIRDIENSGGVKQLEALVRFSNNMCKMLKPLLSS